MKYSEVMEMITAKSWVPSSRPLGNAQQVPTSAVEHPTLNTDRAEAWRLG